MLWHRYKLQATSSDLQGLDEITSRMSEEQNYSNGAKQSNEMFGHINILTVAWQFRQGTTVAMCE